MRPTLKLSALDTYVKREVVLLIFVLKWVKGHLDKLAHCFIHPPVSAVPHCVNEVFRA